MKTYFSINIYCDAPYFFVESFGWPYRVNTDLLRSNACHAGWEVIFIGNSIRVCFVYFGFKGTEAVEETDFKTCWKLCADAKKEQKAKKMTNKD